MIMFCDENGHNNMKKNRIGFENAKKRIKNKKSY